MVQLPNVSRRVVIISAVLLFVLGIGVSAWWIFSYQPKNTPQEISAPEKKTIDIGKTIEWDDPAGFTFMYPENVVVDKHDEDQENYAHVELTHPDHPGSIIVWAQDPPEGEWTEAIASDAPMIDTTLDGKPAKKTITGSLVTTLTTGTLFDGLIFKVEGMLSDKDYWQAVYDEIMNSFTFKPIPGVEDSEESADDSYYEAPADEEEVIE